MWLYDIRCAPYLSHSHDIIILLVLFLPLFPFSVISKNFTNFPTHTLAGTPDHICKYHVYTIYDRSIVLSIVVFCDLRNLSTAFVDASPNLLATFCSRFTFCQLAIASSSWSSLTSLSLSLRRQNWAPLLDHLHFVYKSKIKKKTEREFPEKQRKPIEIQRRQRQIWKLSRNSNTL